MVGQADKPLVLLVASPGALAIDLVEKFLTRICNVNISSSKRAEWGKHLRHLSDNQALSFSDSIPNRKINYFVYVDESFSFEGQRESGQENFFESDMYKLIKKLVWINEAKFMLLFPKEKQASVKSGEEDNEMDRLMEIVYLGPMISPRLIDRKSIEGSMIADALEGDVVRLPSNKGSVIYPQTTSDVAKELSKNLLSFGFANEQMVFLGKETTPEDFFYVLKRSRPGIRASHALPNFDDSLLHGDNVKTIVSDLPKAVSYIFEYASKNRILPKEPIAPVPPEIDKKNSHRKIGKSINFQKTKKPNIFHLTKNRAIFAFVSLFILIFPFLSLFVGVTTMYASFKRGSQFELRSAERYLQVSKMSTSISIKGLSFYNNIPFVKMVSEPASDIARLFLHVSEIGEDVQVLAKIFRAYSEVVLGESDEDLVAITSSAVLALDSFYRRTGFLTVELKDFGRKHPSFDKHIPSTTTIEDIRRNLLSVKELLISTPDLLGANGKKRYLVLFQNSMELRPTGGFIGSFALVDFQGGKLSNMNVLDVYSADGQLKGHVEPPGPIKEYLDQANWFLRDSNWDPDFKVSAVRAEWFLEKEIDERVDGVIAVDLIAAKNVLGVLEGVYLTDFDREITKENMYEVTQYESENNFFPGSRKKKNFLTALSSEMLAQILEVEGQ